MVSVFGIFFIFVIGSSMQRNNSTTPNTTETFDRWWPLSAWTLTFISATIFFYTDSFSPSYTKETFLGLLLGIPLIYLTFQIKKKFPFNSLLGSLSYGVFLCHFLGIWLLGNFNIAEKGSAVYIVLLFLFSTFISYLGVVVVESKINRRQWIGDSNCLLSLGGCPRMPFCPNSSELPKNNTRNINYMAVFIFRKFFDFEQNVYSRTAS